MVDLVTATAGLTVGASLLGSSSKAKQLEAEAASRRENAMFSVLRGQQKESIIRRRARKHLGKSRTAIAKSGVRVKGSALDALSESAAIFEVDALNARFNSSVEANLLKRGARNLEAGAKRIGQLSAVNAAASILGEL